jgi:peptidyl-prolyl cis-trans isomerase B (cyclophilin B)
VRRAPVLISLVAGTLALGACGKDTEPGARTAPDTTAATKTTGKTTTAKPVVTPRRTKDGCTAVAEPEPRPQEKRKAPRRSFNARLRYVATMRTNCGTVQIKLDAKNFPRTVRSFVTLAGNRFYDGLGFFRIAKPGGNDFVIQGGDPLGTGEGGPGYTVVERPHKGQQYPLGSVVMAKADDEKRGTSGSQFFIVTGDDAVLDPVYAMVGRVIGSSRAVRRIAAVPADPVTEMPIDPVVIKRLTVRATKP